MERTSWVDRGKQMGLSFLRVFLATVAAQWIQAGGPISGMNVSDLLGWAELGASAAATLVLANYLGPWETRYGLQSKK